MKKTLYSIFLLSYTLGYAQLIGVNTESPKANLHITSHKANEQGIIENPTNEVGIKIPTHASFPIVPYDSSKEKETSKAKNGMLIHLLAPASSTTNTQEVHGLYYWDNNSYSWENILTTNTITTDISKIIITGEELSETIGGAQTTALIKFDNIQTFDNDFSIDSKTNEFIIGKPANYYILLTGAISKEGNSGNITLETFRKRKKVDAENEYENERILYSNIGLPQEGNRKEIRNANFYISEVLPFEKNDRISIKITAGTTQITNAYVGSPFSITLIKLD